jgi:membrane protein
VAAFAVLVGAAVNAALDRVWPSAATATARAERLAAGGAPQPPGHRPGRTHLAADDGSAPAAPPAEFPERWAQFLPPDDVRSRLHPRHRHRGRETGSNGRGASAPSAGPGAGAEPESGPGAGPQPQSGPGAGTGQGPETGPRGPGTDAGPEWGPGPATGSDRG